MCSQLEKTLCLFYIIVRRYVQELWTNCWQKILKLCPLKHWGRTIDQKGPFLFGDSSVTVQFFSHYHCNGNKFYFLKTFFQKQGVQWLTGLVLFNFILSYFFHGKNLTRFQCISFLNKSHRTLLCKYLTGCERYVVLPCDSFLLLFLPQKKKKKLNSQKIL